MQHYATAKKGQILIPALIVMGVLLVLTTALLSLSNTLYRLTVRTVERAQATALAEAGIEKAVRDLNAGGGVNETETSFGKGAFVVKDLTATGVVRTLEATGYVPNALNPRIKKTVRTNVAISGNSVEFFYGIQVDSGGLQMNNNSRVNGNIYSNGSIVGESGTVVSGDAVVAGGISDQSNLEWTTQTADQFFAKENGNRDIAQSFAAPASDKLNRVSVYLGKVGNPTNNLVLRLTQDNGDKPATASLADVTFPYTSVGVAPGWVDLAFPTPATLTLGAKYWLVLDSGADSPTNYWNWRKDPTDGYAGHTGKYTGSWNANNANWTNVGGDLAFRVWVGGQNTRIENMLIGSATSGTARANLFVNTTVHGSVCPNQYCIVSNPARQELPLSVGVIQDWRNAAAAGGTCALPECNTSGDFTLTNGATGSLGPKKIAGNLTVDNGATLTVTGTLWVVGTMTFSNNAIIKLDPGYGAASGALLTDANVAVANNVIFQGSGQPGSYVMLLSAKQSQNENVMTVSNNSLGVIYYASAGRIHFSNNAQAKEATGYGITLGNNASISYESGLSSIFFSSGPGGGWGVVKGTWRLVQ